MIISLQNQELARRIFERVVSEGIPPAFERMEPNEYMRIVAKGSIQAVKIFQAVCEEPVD